MAVGHGETRFRHQFTQLGDDGVNGLHAVVHEIDLAVAVQFAQDGTADGAGVPGQDLCFDGQAIGGRHIHQAQVADAQHGHVQCAWNGRGGHGDHIQIGLQLLDLLLVHHAEALLFIHHQQTQFVECHILGEEAVGANEHIHLAAFHFRQNLGDFFGRPEAAEHFHAGRIFGVARAEGVVVLLGQNGRGHKDGGLVAVAHRLEHGAHGHFRLAEAHITTHQAIHGPARFHVGLASGNGIQLVAGFLEFESGFHFLLPQGVRPEAHAFAHAAPGVKFNQLIGHLLDGGLGFALGAIPFAGAQLAQLDVRFFAGRVLLHIAEMLQSHIDAVVIGVAQLQDFALVAIDLDGGEAFENAHAIANMHHGVAALQVLNASQGGCAPESLHMAAHAGAAKNFVIGIDCQAGIVGDKAFVQSSHAQGNAVQLQVFQDFAQTLHLARVVAKDMTGIAFLPQTAQIGGQQAHVAHESFLTPGPQIQHILIVRLTAVMEDQSGAAQEPLHNAGGRGIAVLWRKVMSLLAQCCPGVQDLLGVVLQVGAHRVQGRRHHQGVLAQQIEELGAALSLALGMEGQGHAGQFLRGSL